MKGSRWKGIKWHATFKDFLHVISCYNHVIDMPFGDTRIHLTAIWPHIVNVPISYLIVLESTSFCSLVGVNLQPEPRHLLSFNCVKCHNVAVKLSGMTAATHLFGTKLIGIHAVKVGPDKTRIEMFLSFSNQK